MVYSRNDLFGHRNFGLDVMRALSIMLVVISHIFTFEFLELGVWGVEVFFVLSGFLIGQILIRDFQYGISLNGILNFWKRRWYRTLPLYYAVIFVKFVFFDSSLGLKIFAYIFFLQNNFVGINFLGVSWSLVIEEWFYLLVPISFVFFFKNGFSKKTFFYALILAIIGFIALRTVWVIYTNRPFDAIRPNFIFRFDSLLIGVLLAHLKMHYEKWYSKLTDWKICMFGFIVMLFLIFSLGKIHGIEFVKADKFIFYRTLWFALFSFSIFLIIPFFERSELIKKAATYKPVFLLFTWTSVLTYSMYLIHLFVFHIHIPLNNDLLVLLIRAILLYLFSYLIYRFYEHPMMMLRDKKIFSKTKTTA